MQNSNYKAPHLLTVQQFNKEYPVFTIGTLRRLIFNAETNGFNKVIYRISPTGGRGKILIDVAKFFCWLDEQNQKGGENYEKLR